MNLKRASRESRLPTTSSGSVGDHSPSASTTPTGSVVSSPSSVRKETVTVRGESGEPVLRANYRIVGCSTVTQIGAVVAVEPPGRSSEREPSRNGWLPSTIAAPPVSAQLPPASKPPSGAGWYHAT